MEKLYFYMNKLVNHDHIYEKALNDLFEEVSPSQVRLKVHELDYLSYRVKIHQNSLVV